MDDKALKWGSGSYQDGRIVSSRVAYRDDDYYTYKFIGNASGTVYRWDKSTKCCRTYEIHAPIAVAYTRRVYLAWYLLERDYSRRKAFTRAWAKRGLEDIGLAKGQSALFRLGGEGALRKVNLATTIFSVAQHVVQAGIWLKLEADGSLGAVKDRMLVHVQGYGPPSPWREYIFAHYPFLSEINFASTPRRTVTADHKYCERNKVTWVFTRYAYGVGWKFEPNAKRKAAYKQVIKDGWKPRGVEDYGTIVYEHTME